MPPVEDATGIKLTPPQGWQPIPRDRHRTAVTWLARRSAKGKPVAQVAVLKNIREVRDVKHAATSLESSQRLSVRKFAEKSAHPVGIPGADHAYRIDYTYAGVDRHGRLTGHTITGVDITIGTGEHHQSLVRITTRKGKIDQDTIERMVDSVELAAK